LALQQVKHMSSKQLFSIIQMKMNTFSTLECLIVMFCTLRQKNKRWKWTSRHEC